jgi:hypothetical protein
MSSERLEDQDLIDIISEETERYIEGQTEKHINAGNKPPSEKVLEQWGAFHKLEMDEFAIDVLRDIEKLWQIDLGIEKQS